MIVNIEVIMSINKEDNGKNINNYFTTKLDS